MKRFYPSIIPVVIEVSSWHGFFSIHKWKYDFVSSWKHGTAYLGWIKVIW